MASNPSSVAFGLSPVVLRIVLGADRSLPLAYAEAIFETHFGPQCVKIWGGDKIR